MSEIYILCGTEPYGSTWPVTFYESIRDAEHDIARVQQHRSKEFGLHQDLHTLPEWATSNSKRRFRAPACFELWSVNLETTTVEIAKYYD